jgi:hemolysin activation/secretion protein
VNPRSIFFLGLLVGGASQAFAQTSPATTAIGNNPAVQQYQGAQPATQSRAATPAKAVVEGTPAPEPAAPTKPTPSFRINRILFEGNTVITLAELQAIAKPYEHRTVNLAELKELTGKVRALYQSRGYILTRAAIPPQKLRSGGDVRVVVSEGKFGEATVEGNKHYSDEFVLRHFERAMRGGIVEQSALQRSLLILNEFGDLTVRSLFLPGKEPGTSDVLLRVTDRKPFHFGFDFNNYGNPQVGRNRAGLALWYGNAIVEGDEITARYTEPFPSESDPLVQAGYTVPVGDDGNRVSYSFAQASTKVSGDLAILGIQGDAEIHSLIWQRPIQRTLSKSSNVNAGFVFKTVENFVLENQLISQDNLRMLTVGIDTNAVWGNTRTLFSVLITQGLGEMFHGNRQGSPRSSRVGSGNEFTKYNVELFHVRDLGNKQYLLGRFSGQVSLDPLTVSEQFALGGPDSVRGYLQSDFLGDNGYTTSVEYRRHIWTSELKSVNIQGAAFFDHGDANLQLPQIGEFESRSFTGVGAGIRAGIDRTTSIRVDVGFPLTDRNSLDKDKILYAQLVSRW